MNIYLKVMEKSWKTIMHTFYIFDFIKLYCKSYVKIPIFHYQMGSNTNLKPNNIWAEWLSHKNN